LRSREEGVHSRLKTTVRAQAEGRASGGGRRKERNGGIKKRHEASALVAGRISPDSSASFSLYGLTPYGSSSNPIYLFSSCFPSKNEYFSDFHGLSVPHSFKVLFSRSKSGLSSIPLSLGIQHHVQYFPGLYDSRRK